MRARLQKLMAVNRAIVSTLDYEEVLRIVVRETADFTRADSCLLILDDGTGTARVEAWTGVEEEKISDFSAPFDEKVHEALRKVLGYSDEDLFLGAAVVSHAQIRGVLVVYRRGASEVEEEDMSMVVALADQAAIALEHAARYRDVRRSSEHKSRLLESIHDNTTSGLAYLDREFRIIQANEEFGRALATDPDALIGRPWGTCADRPEILSLAEEARRTGEPVQVVEHRRPDANADATPSWWDFSARAVKDEHERVEGIVLSAVDVTEKVEARRKLEEINRRKDEYLAMLGHELRNPLSVIATSIEVLNRQPTEDQAQVAVRTAARQMGHMRKLLDGLLEVSRITQGKIELEWESVDLRDVVEQALHSTERLVRSKAQHLDISLPSVPTLFFADRHRLVQVLTNVLSNAVRYTAEKGNILLQATRRGDSLEILVRDDGSGIHPDLLPRVFDLFIQADQGLGRTQGGLGIGLTIVKQIVELHGGTVRARSPGPGLGSEFIIDLPLLAEAPGGPHSVP